MERENAMMEKNPGKWTYLPALMAALLLLAAGVGAGVAAQVGVQGESDVMPVDTTWEGGPEVPKVYNSAKAGATGRSVPMVALDTNTYEKKFWLSEKQLLSEPVKSVYPKVTGSGSIAYVVYSTLFPDPDGWHIYRTYSVDYGANWSSAYEVQVTSGTGGRPCPLISGERVILAYATYFTQEAWFSQLLFRWENTDLFNLSDSIVLDMSVGSSSNSVFGPSLLMRADTIFCIYLNHHDDASYITIQKSFDLGESWIPSSADAGTAPGLPLNCLLNDTVMSIVHRGGNEVVIIRSFDGGYTWTPDEYISSDDIYASQGPRGAGDGVSAILTIWWDFEGAPGGWYGFPFYRRSLDHGDTWGEIRSLSAGANTDYVDVWADT
ncbi:MAG: exo-alpha-sialidase, partial [candidate division Zixibacteria bacterium]|nr:exo-alpha-sialidase [candidate division Zixibacteria bacterium]